MKFSTLHEYQEKFLNFIQEVGKIKIKFSLYLV
jgi:hypothetical protein